MRLITERDSIESAIESFIRQHGNGTYGYDRRGIMVGEELSKLDKETVSAEEVNSLIGNDWVSKTCHDCGSIVKDIVQVGEEPDYERCYANICFDCLENAVKLKHLCK
jgi:hypothetical protein